MAKMLKKIIEECRRFKESALPVIYAYKDKREKLFKEFDKEEMRNTLRKIKEKSIKNIKELKRKAIKNLEANGFRVIEVRNQKHATDVIRKIVGAEKLIVKSKSNTGDEIELGEILKDKELIETDLGDFLVDIAHEHDMHPVMPAFHMTVPQIVGVMKKRFGKDVEPKPEKIVAFVMAYLREKITKAKIGITGANVVTSDGRVIILENEGNISLVSRIPEKHIVIVGWDKIVPTLEDALHIIRCAAIFGAGKDYPVYVSIISGPSKTGDIRNELVTGAQGAKEVYVILLDNGRSSLLKHGYEELLYCINCGACLNFCPIYHQIADDYGSKYIGSKGVLFACQSESVKKAFDSGTFYCTLCQACKDNCPAKIDLPELMKKLRQESVKQKIQPKNAEKMIKNIRKHGNPFGKVEKGKMPKNMYCC